MRMISHQMETVNKDIDITFKNREPNRNSGVVKYNNQNEKLTGMAQQQIWVDSRNVQFLKIDPIRLFRLRDRKKNNWSKFTEPHRPVGYHKAYQHMHNWSPEGEERKR